MQWAWVLTRRPEEFHDQGGMLLTFVVFPLTLLLWVVGGPMAFVRGWSSRWQILSPGVERWVLLGLILSGIVTLAPLIIVALWRRVF